VAQIDTTSNGQVITYLHTDHLNTPRRGTDVNGITVWAWSGTAFGSFSANEDPDNDGTNTTINLRFPGQVYDQETKLHYNYFRYYDPSTGRYITSDPIGLLLVNPSPEMLLAEEMGIIELPYDVTPGYINNPYVYVANNPLIYTDSYGLFEETMGGFIGLGAGLALADGPFPIGDIIGAGVIIGGGIYLACSAKDNSSGRKGGSDGSKGGHRSNKKGSKKRTNDKHTKPRPGTKTKQRGKDGWYQR